MIKSEIRSEVINALKKYDKSAKYHFRVIDANIESVLNQFYWQVFGANPLALQRYTKQFGYDTPLTVLLDNQNGVYYTTLSNSIIPFPDKASGVRRISVPTQGGITFFPMDLREMDLVDDGNSYVDYMNTRIGYVVKPTRVEYYNMSATVVLSGVRMDIMTPFSQYEDTDIVLIPEIINDQGEGLVDLVVKKLRELPSVDLLDNNADTKE